MSNHGCLIFQVDIRLNLMNFYNPFHRYFASIQSSGPERFMKKPSGGIAQLGERLPCKQEVAGSIPAVSTKQV